MTNEAKPFTIERRVEFRDTDAAGIVHFSAFFPIMESAEHALLRHLGLSVMQELPDGSHLSWPRVAVQCDYQGAAKFEDILRIAVRVETVGNKSVRYGFEMTRDDTAIAKGSITAVCCLWSTGGTLRSVPIPANVRTLLESQMN